MAITITIAEIAAAIRVDDSAEETAEVSRIRDYSVVAISQHLGDAYDDAPEVVVNMAATLLCGWLYDKPTTTGGFSFANAIKFSGAIRVLFPYKAHSVGLVGGRGVAAATAAGIGTVGNPVTDVDIIGDELVITFADGSTESHTLPAGGGGGGSGATAAEITALIANHAAMPEIHHIQGGTSLIVGNIIEGRLPGTPIAMRMGWGETNPPMANVFVRDNNHPYDGAAVGTSELTYMPPFPPALAAEHTLFVFIWLEGSPVDAAIWVNPGLDNQGDFSAYFSDGDPLEVEGVAGTAYVSLFQFSLNESQGYASPQPGPLLATQTWVTAEIANIMLSGGGITTGQAQALIDAAVVNFQTATEIQAVVTAAIAALPDYQTLAEVNALITTAIDALTLGQTAAEVQTLIDLHAGMPNIHHAPGGGGGPVEIVGPWQFVYLTPMAAGLLYYAAQSLPGVADTWIFTTGSNAEGRAQLTALEIGDTLLIEQSDATTRYQNVTLTLAPDITGLNITIYGTADRTGTFEIPGSSADVTVTVIPPTPEGIDQTARDAAETAQADLATHEATPHGGGGGGGTAVLLGTATASGTPIQISLPQTQADGVIAAYNAGTYPGGYRVTLVWDAASITHVVEKTFAADLFPTLVDGRNYYFHLDASAGLNETISRYLSLGRVPNPDNVQIVSLPTSHDFEAGTVFTIWGLP